MAALICRYMTYQELGDDMQDPAEKEGDSQEAVKENGGEGQEAE